MRWVLRLFFLALVAVLALAGYGYWSATREPVVREARVEIRGWPAGQGSLRILLLSDIHIQGPDMSPQRLLRIVAQANALRPDLVLIAGDFIGDKEMGTRAYSEAEMAAPLAQLQAPLGRFAVLGNHDHWNNAPAVRAALTGVGIRVLMNEAVRAGPLALGGIDDDHTGRSDLGRTLVAMQMAGGVPVLLSHSPDPFPALPDDVPLMLAGHTHCGQIRLPIVGPLATASRHGKRYACGRYNERGRTLIVSAGLGTSVLPFRIGAAPDMWLITLTPAVPPVPRAPAPTRSATPSAAPETSPEKRRTER
ncbi:MAG TPA: metallophosphoesterase [Allosphingosinicella sp.]|nr:metallophosphoesterase [Allosphingosinicella sp.]